MTATAALVAIVATACGGGSGDVGASLPDVEVVPLVDGEADEAAMVSLRDIEGPAVINLWATWCVPCRTEIPDFEIVHRARADEVTFVGINIGEEGAAASAFLAEVGATYVQYLDPKGFVQTGLEATSMPVTVVIDADGEIVTRHLGRSMSQDDLNAAIDAALAG